MNIIKQWAVYQRGEQWLVRKGEVKGGVLIWDVGGKVFASLDAARDHIPARDSFPASGGGDLLEIWL